jgi:hypothetical protein
MGIHGCVKKRASFDSDFSGHDYVGSRMIRHNFVASALWPKVL